MAREDIQEEVRARRHWARNAWLLGLKGLLQLQGNWKAAEDEPALLNALLQKAIAEGWVVAFLRGEPLQRQPALPSARKRDSAFRSRRPFSIPRIGRF